MSNYQAKVENQALLFALLARQALCQSQGEAALRRAVAAYARRRGRRMAERARQDGLPADAASYLLYGEWAVEPGASAMCLPAFEPEINLQNACCPWYNLWQERGLLEYGKHYCATLDAELARGFAPELVLETMQTLHEADYCDFYFRGAALDAAAQQKLARNQQKLARNQQKLGQAAKMDWNYHTADLYCSMLDTFRAAWGDEAAAQISAEALAAYQETYGEQALRQLLADVEQDFEHPVYAGTPGLER